MSRVVFFEILIAKNNFFHGWEVMPNLGFHQRIQFE